MNETEEIIKTKSFEEYYHYYHDKNFIFTGHRHSHWEINIILNGELEVTCDSKIYRLSQNTVFLCEPDLFHRSRVSSNSLTEQIVFQFFSDSLNLNLSPKIYHLDQYLYNLLQLIKCECEDTVQFEGEQNLNINKRAKMLLDLFLTRLSLSKQEKISFTPEKDMLIFSQAARYMKKNLNRKISIKSISENCCVSQTKLKNVFTKYTDSSVMTYYNDIKLNTAKQLLTSGKRVGETGDLLGFSSEAYFSLWFKKLTGKSPFKYINSK